MILGIRRVSMNLYYIPIDLETGRNVSMCMPKLEYIVHPLALFLRDIEVVMTIDSAQT